MRVLGTLFVVAMACIAWHAVTAQPTNGVVAHPAQVSRVATTTTAPRLTSPPIGPTNPTGASEADTTLYGSPALYELRLEHLISATVKVYDARRDLFIPVRQFCRLAELPYDIDIPHRIARLGNFTARWAPNEGITVRDTLYLSLTALDRATHAVSEIDRGDASITLSDINSFPIAQRIKRSEAREKLLHDIVLAERDTTPITATHEGAWGGLSLDYTLLGQTNATNALQGYSFDATTMAADGSLVVRANGLGSTLVDGGASWSRAWPDGHAVAQLRVGDGTTSGLGSLWSRGLLISNAPLVRPPTVAVIPLDGSLPADWSIEAYHDGALVAFDSVGANGHYQLSVPVQYGDNPFDLVAYGPAGQTQDLAYVFHALPTLLPSHVFQYAASTGACLSASCTWTSNADLQYGVTSRWSVRGGATEYVWHGNSSMVSPYVGITGMPSAGLGIEAEVMAHAYQSASIRFDPSPIVSLVGDYTKYTDSRAAVVNTGGTWSNTFSMYGSIASGPYRPELEVQALHTSNQFGTEGFERVASTVNLPGGTFRPYMRIVQSTLGSQSFVGTDLFVTPSAWGIGGLRSWLLRGTVESTPQRALSESQLIFSHVDTHRFHVEGGMTWQRLVPGPRFTIALVTNLSAMRSVTTLTSGRGVGAAIQQTMNGSLRWDPTLGRFDPSPDPMLDRSGVSGVVFLDANGNGQFDPGEQVLPNVRVRVDNTIVTTDDHGHYEMLGVLPTEIAVISVDTGSLTSPWWSPTANKLRVRTLPNHVVSVDVPIVPTGVVEGAITTTSGEGLHVHVTLTNLATRQRRTMETFSDGGFYQMGIPPGRYSVTVDAGALAAKHLVASAVQCVVTGGATTHDVRITARPQ